MMNVVSIAFLIMKKRVKPNAILIVLTSLLFLSVSVMLAGINNGRVRFRPYENILNKQGAFVFGAGYDVDDAGGIDSYLDKLEIPGGYDTMCFYESSGSTDSGIPINVVVCDDDFLKELNLPLKYRVPDSQNCISVYMPENNSIGIGEEFTVSSVFPGKTFKVTKLYSDFTYSPTMTRFNLYSLDYTLFYKSYKKDDPENNTPFVIISDKDIPNIGKIFPSSGFFVYYPEEISSQSYNSFIKKLPVKMYTEFSRLNENSRLRQKNNLLKYVPISLTFSITVIFGLLCCIAIFTMQDLRRMGILAISGMSKRQCLLIYAVNFSFVLLSSVLINLLMLKAMSFHGIDAKIGLVYSAVNISLTIVLMAAFTAAGILIPVKIIYSKKPQQLLIET
ncbi:MAG: hypothetical protein ACI4JW_06985 [Oscillospiraceae bacterium]